MTKSSCLNCLMTDNQLPELPAWPLQPSMAPALQEKRNNPLRSFHVIRTWSKRVAKRLSAVRMPPLGPRLYCCITFL